jgi:RING-variant domain
MISSNDASDDRGIHYDTDLDDPARDDNSGTPPSEPYDPDSTNNKLTCSRTGLAFPTSVPLKLLEFYDDGVTPKVSLAPFPTEQIFCRICREGLHEDADTEQPNAANEDADNTNAHIEAEFPEISNQNDDDDINDDTDEPSSIKASEPYSIGPVLPHPTYMLNTDAVQNPILAPCECSGSMAFVHYMCVEQWRCRSRHPNARNGLNCETCGKPYALPPPSERQGVQLEHEDWLDAMPPHVMQALRQPHIWWQLGAAIVRRRWLRPLAPIFMSPIVALYCRARRMLKKRGVARRRWACSLCRRRARWKCVRCLRSYYCSRQCQNVSWHIIHKHVCYKPVRFWWSVVVYGAIALLLFPGILRDPLMYDLGVCIIPLSFIIMAVLGGGVASIVKRVFGVDIRGRLLELAAVVSTLWLAIISWGLIRGFFGMPSLCYGSIGSKYDLTAESISTSYSILRPFRWVILQPAEKLYLFCDRLILKYSWLRILFCSKSARGGIDTSINGCFEHTPHANADFILKNMNQTIVPDVDGTEDYGYNSNCAADLTIVLSLYILAGVAFAGSALLKHQERQRRRQLRHHHHPQHAHQFAFHLQQQQQQQHQGNRPRLILGIGFPQLPQRVGGGNARPHQD